MRARLAARLGKIDGGDDLPAEGDGDGVEGVFYGDDQRMRVLRAAGIKRGGKGELAAFLIESVFVGDPLRMGADYGKSVVADADAACRRRRVDDAGDALHRIDRAGADKRHRVDDGERDGQSRRRQVVGRRDRDGVDGNAR